MLTLADIEKEISNITAHGSNRADVACLADLYICRANMLGEDKKAAAGDVIETGGESEFAVCINGRCFSEVLPFIEELLEALKVVNPRLYDGFMRKIK